MNPWQAAAKGAVCLDGSPAAYYLLKGSLMARASSMELTDVHVW